jgi:hypothetical protein
MTRRADLTCLVISPEKILVIKLMGYSFELSVFSLQFSVKELVTEVLNRLKINGFPVTIG